MIILFLASCSVSQKGQMGFYADQRESKPIKWQCVNEEFLNVECKEK